MDVHGATLRQREIVRHQHQRRRMRAIQFEQQIADDATRALIEIAGRFVSEKNARTMHKRTRQCDALLFAAGQLMRIVVAALIESDIVQGRAREVARIRATVEFKRQHHIFLCCQCGQQMKRLKEKSDITTAQRRSLFFIERIDARIRQCDRAARGRVESGEQSEQRRLARSRRADDGETRAFWHVEVHVGENVDATLGALDAFANIGRSDFDFGIIAHALLFPFRFTDFHRDVCTRG